MPTVRLENVTKVYKSKDRRGPAILDVTFRFDQGEFIFLTGSRGAGKSTVMDIIAGELTPDNGAIFVDDVNMKRMGVVQRTRYRRSVGRVRQEPELVRNETVLRNLTGKNLLSYVKDKAKNDARIQKSLGLVGMPGCENRYPLEFSLSECKRIELAKAILHTPQILLLDEITERTDGDTVWDMLHLLKEINERLGTTVIMATNSAAVVNYMRQRVITLADGKLVGDVRKGRLGYIE